MIFHEQPDTEWTVFDYKLLEAYQILQDETCPQCGQVMWLCHSEHRDLIWEVNKTTCYATAALEKADKEREKHKKELKPGEQPYVKPKMFGGGSLPSREEFYQAEAEKQKKIR